MATHWSTRLAQWWLSASAAPVPDAVLERAAVHLFDAIACAAGAVDSAPVAAVRRAVSAEHGAGPCTVWFGGGSAGCSSAVLANGTAVRFLDANDVFLGSGPGGHPSDNIPVAIAAGERHGAPGRDVLVAIALSYDLVARLRRYVFRPSAHGGDWHEVSISGPVAAAMSAGLAGADETALANAIAIGAAHGYSLKEIRRGEISMMKAAANALVARGGVVAADLALNGLTGPPAVFEGRSGLLATLGLEPEETIIDALCAPPQWAILDASIKPFPAFGTSQAAVSAAVEIAETLGPIDPTAVDHVDVKLPNTPWTREYVGLEERRSPRTRETADHSMQFLVAVALLDGSVTQAQYEGARWLDDDVRSVMERLVVTPDDRLAEHTTAAFPAAVVLRLADGNTIEQEALRPPGSPANPWSLADVAGKMARLDRVGLGEGRISEISMAAGDLEQGDLGRLIAAIRGAGGSRQEAEVDEEDT